MRMLIVVSNTSVIDVSRLKERIEGYDIQVNTTPDEMNIISIVDLAHEAQVNKRWPEQVIVVGDTVSKWKTVAQYELPEEGAQSAIEHLFNTEEFVQEEEDVVEVDEND